MKRRRKGYRGTRLRIGRKRNMTNRKKMIGYRNGEGETGGGRAGGRE